jgi:hypothetical protein
MSISEPLTLSAKDAAGGIALLPPVFAAAPLLLGAGLFAALLCLINQKSPPAITITTTKAPVANNPNGFLPERGWVVGCERAEGMV